MTTKTNLLRSLRAAMKIVQDAEFKESEHGRADNGQFGSGGGGEKKAEGKAQRASWGSESSTPSGEKKSSLSLRDLAAITNTGKFSKMENAASARDGQKYRTNILKGEGNQLWVPATNREESILRRLGYKES